MGKKSFRGKVDLYPTSRSGMTVGIADEALQIEEIEHGYIIRFKHGFRIQWLSIDVGVEQIDTTPDDEEF